FPEWMISEPGKPDFLICYSVLDGFHVFMEQLQMVDCDHKIHRFDWTERTPVMRRQYKRRAHGTENPIVNRRHFGQLHRLQRRMDDGSSKRFIVSRAS